MSDWEVREKIKYDNAYLKGYAPGNSTINEFENRVCSVVKKYANKRIKLLDVGCGPAYVNEIAKNYNIDMMGIDLSTKLIPYWRHYNIPAVVASGAHIPFKDNIFDFIVCWEVMEHIPEEGVRDVFKEIFRVGKGGSLFSFSINLRDCNIKKFGDLGEMHVTIKKATWWIKILKDIGFMLNLSDSIDYDNNTEGTSICGLCVIQK